MGLNNIELITDRPLEDNFREIAAEDIFNLHHHEKSPWVDKLAWVVCNLCALICPVDDCISMVEVIA